MSSWMRCDVCEGKGEFFPRYGPRGQNGYDYPDNPDPDYDHTCGNCGGRGEVEIPDPDPVRVADDLFDTAFGRRPGGTQR